MKDQPILVVGSTGKTGRRVAATLESMGLPVRRGSRSSSTPFDWEASETWAPALKGARAAYVTYFPDLAFPGAVEKLEDFTKVALETGLKHIVLLSGRGEAPLPRAPDQSGQAEARPGPLDSAEGRSVPARRGQRADILGGQPRGPRRTD